MSMSIIVDTILCSSGKRQWKIATISGLPQSVFFF